MVERVARQVSIPFTVGGGISEIDDVDRLLSAGADKISINSSALVRPQFSERFTFQDFCQDAADELRIISGKSDDR